MHFLSWSKKIGSMQTGRYLTLHIDWPTDNFEYEIGCEIKERERECVSKKVLKLEVFPS